MRERRLWPRSREGPRRSGLDRREASALIERLNRDGARIAARFGLTYRAIVAERPSARGHFGICYEDGLIKIRLQHATRGTALKYSSLVSTLCHELAHLRHFDHDEGFQGFYAELLGWARRRSIYRPRRRSTAPPEVEECGVSAPERRRFLDRMRAAAAGASARPVRPIQLGLFGGPE